MYIVPKIKNRIKGALCPGACTGHTALIINHRFPSLIKHSLMNTAEHACRIFSHAIQQKRLYECTITFLFFVGIMATWLLHAFGSFLKCSATFYGKNAATVYLQRMHIPCHIQGWPKHAEAPIVNSAHSIIIDERRHFNATTIMSIRTTAQQWEW